MAIDERRRLELAEAVKRTLGEDVGVTLMEMLPPTGWADVATKRDLDALAAVTKRDLDAFAAVTKRDLDALKQDLAAHAEATKQDLAVLEHKLISSFRQELNTQTWRCIGVTGGLFAAFVTLSAAIIKL